MLTKQAHCNEWETVMIKQPGLLACLANMPQTFTHHRLVTVSLWVLEGHSGGQVF